MCGIFGYIGENPQRLDTEKILASLQHRGPDDSGTAEFDKALLAHTRLSIIDLSASGRQPLSTEDKGVWIVLNGEIYNYIELRRALKGYPFRTRTDTEVVLAAYEKWGEHFLAKLRGMFALGLWDNRKRKLICAVDRFGIKPFYYHAGVGTFRFASEVKALLASGLQAEPDNKTIYDYFISGYLCHNDRSFFKGIRRLEAAHCLIYEDGKYKIKQYWQLNEQKPEKVNIEEAIEEIDQCLIESVDIHLRSDVEFGLSLSSGLDSNFLRCLITHQNVLKTPLKCFSFCFDDTPYNECVDLAEDDIAGVTYLKTNVTSDSLIKDLPAIIGAQESPIGGAGTYAYWLNMKLARDSGVKVVLNGQGADELFCGYKYYYESWLREIYRSGDRDSLKTQLEQFNRTHATSYTLESEDFLRLMQSGEDFLTRASDGTYLDKHGYLTEAFLSSESEPPFTGTQQFESSTKNRMFHDLRYIKIPKLLMFQDKTAMSWGVEARVPFLDHVLFEKIFNLPTSLMIQNGLTKYLFRKVAHKYEDPLYRQYQNKKKKYMPTPQREWLKYELTESVKDIIGGSVLVKRGYINKDKLLRLYDDYICDMSLGNSFFIWKFINVESLFNVFRL